MKMKKKTFFRFSILKIFWFMSFAVNFLKSLGKNSKIFFTRTCYSLLQDRNIYLLLEIAVIIKHDKIEKKYGLGK